MKITHCNHKSMVVSKANNIVEISDKLICLAAKLTDRFASDILYDIDVLRDCIKNNTPLDRLLFFRDQGVTARNTSVVTDDIYDALLANFTPIQIWRLVYTPDDEQVVLLQVRLEKGNEVDGCVII